MVFDVKGGEGASGLCVAMVFAYHSYYFVHYDTGDQSAKEKGLGNGTTRVLAALEVGT